MNFYITSLQQDGKFIISLPQFGLIPHKYGNHRQKSSHLDSSEYQDIIYTPPFSVLAQGLIRRLVEHPGETRGR